MESKSRFIAWTEIGESVMILLCTSFAENEEKISWKIADWRRVTLYHVLNSLWE